ncbi:glycosyltransferase family 4 protein [Formosa maritima]|uniref:Glycosyltransferase family 4 protein n=1 Tax=Formosa maritima TaxID=2592046 RepID=A0A5D0GJ31_9FLAO|nr:glycosyltransferase family 4 protein [Formosa maritima]TYA58943.1 glycosyltransferase family 4 protein [Formosa maritima]
MKKSIAFVLPNLNTGGAQRVVSTLANLLVEKYHVRIITLYECKPFYNLDSKISVNFCLSEFNSNPTFVQSIVNNFKLIIKLIKILKNNNVNLAIGFMSTTNIYTIIATKFIRIPNIISERANPEYSSLNNIWTFLRKINYPFSNCLVVQTKANKNYFKTYNKNKIEIINNPIDNNLLFNRNLDIPKENIILNVGRLEEPKNQDLLIHAFNKIKNINWKLILVGDGKNYEAYNKLIASLNMQDKIILVGNYSDVAFYYNKAKIFAFTSKYEGFPNVIIEAMSYGLACISTDCPHGPSEIIKNNENGILIPVGDQIALEKNLTILTQNPKLLKTLSNNAIISAADYNPNKIALEWSTLINKII